MAVLASQPLIAANMLAVSSHTMHHTLVSAGHCKETVCYGQLYYTWTCALCESVCVLLYM